MKPPRWLCMVERPENRITQNCFYPPAFPEPGFLFFVFGSPTFAAPAALLAELRAGIVGVDIPIAVHFERRSSHNTFREDVDLFCFGSYIDIFHIVLSLSLFNVHFLTVHDVDTALHCVVHATTGEIIDRSVSVCANENRFDCCSVATETETSCL